MTSRRMLAGALACLGSGALLVGLLVPGAAAQGELHIYEADGLASAARVSVAVRPLTLQVAENIGVAVARTGMSALPLSEALGSVVFPGEFAHSVSPQTCGGDCPGTSTARHPKPREREATVLRYPAPGSFEDGVIAGRVEIEGGNTHARAERLENLGTTTASTIEIRPERGADPVVTIGGATVTATSANTGARIEQVSSVQADGISIANGLVIIDSLRSEARAATGGGPAQATGVLTIGKVTAVVGGISRRAEIRSDGVHIVSPELSENVRQSLDANLDHALGDAGVRITRATITQLDDEEGTAEASVGGLVVSVVAPPVPVHGDRLSVDIVLGGAFASTLGISFPPVTPPPPAAPGCPPSCPQQPPPQIITQPPQTVVQQVPVQQPAPAAPAPAGPTHMVGLVARLPATALLVSGLGALVLAVGTALGPSLRR